jgi:hypothetical protein
MPNHRKRGSLSRRQPHGKPNAATKSKVDAFEIRVYPLGLSVNVRRLVKSPWFYDWRMYQSISPASVQRILRCAPLLLKEHRP